MLTAPQNMTTTVAAPNSAEIDLAIKGQLDIFSSLVSQYVYGQPLVEANGGFHIDKGLQQVSTPQQQLQQSSLQQMTSSTTMQGRSTLLQALQCDHPIPFGPLTNTKSIVQVPSEGEDSEIDITDLVSISTGGVVASQDKTSSSTANQSQKPWGSSVQDAWQQQQHQNSNISSGGAPLVSSFDKLHPHTLKLFQGKVVSEEKGGPRIRDILEQVIDLKSLKPIDSIRKCLPEEHIYSGQLAVYLTLQGLDPHQKAMQIARRLKSWLAMYDTQHQYGGSPRVTISFSNGATAQIDTRPTSIHVYPNQLLDNLAISAEATSQNNSQQSVQNKESHSHRSSSQPSDERNSPNRRDNQQVPRRQIQQQAGSGGNSSTPTTLCLMQFHDPRALEHVYKVLRTKGGKQIVNNAKQPIKFGLAYDSRCLGEYEWVGVILRNLPSNATSTGIKNNFTKFSPTDLTQYSERSLTSDGQPYQILEISEPLKIKDQYCSVIQVPDIEQAERICLKWDGMEVNDKHQKLKVHLHPYSYRKRPSDKLSIHSLFKDRFDPQKTPQIIKQEAAPAAMSINANTIAAPQQQDASVIIKDQSLVQEAAAACIGSTLLGKPSAAKDAENLKATQSSQLPPRSQDQDKGGFPSVGQATTEATTQSLITSEPASLTMIKVEKQKDSTIKATTEPEFTNNTEVAEGDGKGTVDENQSIVKQEPALAPKKQSLYHLLNDVMDSGADNKNEDAPASKPAPEPAVVKLAIMEDFDMDEAAERENRRKAKQRQKSEKRREYERLQQMKEALAAQQLPQKKLVKQGSSSGLSAVEPPTKRVKREEATGVSATAAIANANEAVKQEQNIDSGNVVTAGIKREDQSTNAAEPQ